MQEKCNFFLKNVHFSKKERYKMDFTSIDPK